MRENELSERDGEFPKNKNWFKIILMTVFPLPLSFVGFFFFFFPSNFPFCVVCCVHSK